MPFSQPQNPKNIKPQRENILIEIITGRNLDTRFAKKS
jgi:hypothetical protein